MAKKSRYQRNLNIKKQLAAKKKRLPASRKAIATTKSKTQKKKLKAKRQRLTGRRKLLGPMGQINQSTLLTIELRPGASQWIGRGNTKIGKHDLYDLIMKLVYNPLVVNYTAWVERWAPKDTGDLRKALLLAITNSGASKTDISNLFGPDGMIVVMDTKGIPYAKPVNLMPTDWVRHPGKHKPGTRGRTGNILNDPEATTQWYNLIRKFTRSLVKSRVSILRRTIGRQFGGGSQGYNIVRRMLKITDGARGI